MSRGSRSGEAIARRVERAKRRYAARKARPVHPFLSADELAEVHGLRGPEPDTIIFGDTDTPDRSAYRDDPDRQEAIRAHAARVRKEKRPPKP